MISDWRPPVKLCLRILTWLPSWSTYSKPNFAKILRSSCPDRVLSFGMNKRVEFEGRKYGWVLRKTKFRQILVS